MKNFSKRKVIAFILTLMLTLSMTTAAFVNASADASKKGDPDGDDKVGMTDVVLIQRSIAELTALSESQKSAADVTFNGLVQMDDVTTIQRYIADLITEFVDENNTDTDSDTATDTEVVSDTDTETKSIEVGSVVVFKKGSVNDADGVRVDALNRYALYTVKEINGENASIEMEYHLNGHYTHAEYVVALADLEFAKDVPVAGEISNELKVNALVTIKLHVEKDKMENPISEAEQMLVYRIVSISTDSDAIYEINADYVLKGFRYTTTKFLPASQISLYEVSNTWGYDFDTTGEIKLGSLVTINRDSKDYSGKTIADVWYLGRYTVTALDGDKATLSLDINKAFLDENGLTSEFISEQINANKEGILDMPLEDILEILARFGKVVGNPERISAALGMLTGTTVAPEMVDTVLSMFSYKFTLTVNVNDLKLFPVQ